MSLGTLATRILGPKCLKNPRRFSAGSVNEPQIAQHLNYMEAEVGKSTWFAGNEFTAADIQISFPLEAAVARAGLNASRPKLMAFLNRIHTRPAYQQALERGGTYELLS